MAKRIWTTKTGTKIKIKDMTTDHLRNAIAYLERFAQACYENAISNANFMCGFVTGEQAINCAEDAFDSLLEEGSYEDFLPPVYEDLQNELSKRTILDGDNKIVYKESRKHTQRLGPVITPEELRKCQRGDEASNENQWK